MVLKKIISTNFLYFSFSFMEQFNPIRLAQSLEEDLKEKEYLAKESKKMKKKESILLMNIL